jgi:hypothetical protein
MGRPKFGIVLQGWVRVCLSRFIAEGRSWLLVDFPRHKNNIVENIWCTVVTCKNEKFLAVHQVGVMILHKCRVDRPFPYHVIRC